jgi:aspartate oxidase
MPALPSGVPIVIGAEILRALAVAVRANPNITLLEGAEARRLAVLSRQVGLLREADGLC